MLGILGWHIRNLYSVRSQVGGLLGGGGLRMQECANHHQEYEKCLHPSLLVARQSLTGKVRVKVMLAFRGMVPFLPVNHHLGMSMCVCPYPLGVTRLCPCGDSSGLLPCRRGKVATDH